MGKQHKADCLGVTFLDKDSKLIGEFIDGSIKEAERIIENGEIHFTVNARAYLALAKELKNARETLK